MTRYCLIGPTYPFRGGIAHYTTLLARQLGREHEPLLISFTRQYPGWLFPGRSDRDPSRRPLTTDAEYLLDPLNPISWRRTVHRIREWHPDAVVIPWWVPYWAPAWAVIGRGAKRTSTRPKLLFICHNVLPHEKGLLDKLALRAALGPGDGFIVHSEADAHRLRRQISQAEIRVTPHPSYALLGQDKTGHLPVNLPEDRPVIIFFGFVRAYKGLDVLLEAVRLVQHPLHLLVAGEFWEDEGLYRQQISRLKLQDKVTLINEYVPDEELAAYVAASEVAVLPYRSATQSGVVQVAFGQERPVITTNVGGLPEVVEHGRTGLIVPPDDPKALAAAINQFFDEDMGPRFQANIRQSADRFGWSKLIAELEWFSRTN